MSLANRMCLCERHGSYVSYVRCMVDDPERQKRECPGYLRHPADEAVRAGGLCWFNHDAREQVTDECHRPGSLTTPVDDERAAAAKGGAQ